MPQRIQVDQAPAAVGPYSHATLAGGLLYLSGQIALEPKTGALVEGGIAEQTERVMQNIALVLQGCNSGWDQVVKTTIFITNMADFALVNEIYGKYLGQTKPSRSTLGVASLPKGALVEIEVIACPKN